MSSRAITDGSGLVQVVSDHIALTKPRVISLLLWTAFGGMVIADRGIPALTIVAAVLIGGALASGGASSINQALEGELDVAMRRTSNRPVASGRVGIRHAIVYGLVLNIGAFALIVVGANLLAALLTLSGTLIYVFIYTIWLKRSTTQNIVIGGAAGAVPPMVGWAAVTGDITLPAWYLFAIIFFWTPPHFWALAIMIKDDYKAAGVPMLPVIVGFNETRRAIFLYTWILLGLTSLLYVTTDHLSMMYLGGSLALGVIYIGFAGRLWRNTERRAVVALYLYSLLYLALLFGLMMVDASFI